MSFPEKITFEFEKLFDLRYGENPHQDAAFYVDPDYEGPGVANARKLHGKQLSFNNILDLDAALSIVREFEEPAAAVMKHTNPCGAATADTISKAYEDAHATDPMSAFGSIVALNRPCDTDTAQQINETFVEAVIAPGYMDEALEILKTKENIRLLEIASFEAPAEQELDVRRVAGGVLVQERDVEPLYEKLEVVTEREPTEREMRSLLFGWRIVKHVKSNAIVFSQDTRTMGIGAGQMSRVDAVELAIKKARDTQDCTLASDAFFPFRDNVDRANEAGVTAIIQPGGSIRDEESVEAADEHGMAMIFTGTRHFRH